MGCGASASQIEATEDSNEGSTFSSTALDTDKVKEYEVDGDQKHTESRKHRKDKLIDALSPPPLSSSKNLPVKFGSKTLDTVKEDSKGKRAKENRKEDVEYSLVSKESTKISKVSAYMNNRMNKYKNFPIRLLHFDVFKKQREIPRYPECKELVETFNPETFDYTNAIICYVSHCWIAGWNGRDANDVLLSKDHERNWRGKPHPDNKKNDKFKLIVEGVESIWMTMAPTITTCYLWLDYSCMNQDGNPAKDMEYLDLVMRLSDLVITPVVDVKWDKWKVPGQSANWYEAYQAETFKGTRFSYLNRAWCRVEMLYTSKVPLADHTGEQRTMKFRGALQQSATEGIRCHFLYGTKENKEGLSGRILPPYDARRYDPLAGYLSVDGDRHKIVELMKDVQPYFQNERPEQDDDDDIEEKEEGTRGVESSKGDKKHWNDDDDKRKNKYKEPPILFEKTEEKQRKFKPKSGKGQYEFGGGNVFKGTLVNGLREGYGVLTSKCPASLFRGEFQNDAKVSGYEEYPDGSTYEGAYADNLKSGLGTITFPNKDIYSGEWGDDKMHGIGKYQYASGASYEGFFENNLMSGRGVYTSKEGHQYDGTFRDDLKHGRGTYRFTNGELYSGEYQDNLRHGHGIYHFQNGDVYDGEWKQDKRTGLGIFTYDNGQAVYKGQFLDGAFDGNGELDFHNRRYEGTFQQNKMHGKGTLKSTNGNIFIGDFVQGKREGSNCRLIFGKDHCEYIGRFHNDDMNGVGKYIFSNGDVFEGEFKNGKRHGRGVKRIAATGQTKKGLWADDKFVK